MPATLPALIIVDMQKGMARPADRNNPDAESNIAALLAAWRQAGAQVVHVRHISRSPDSAFWPGQDGVEFQDAFVPRDDEHVVEKNVTDCFIHSGLERWLRVRGTGQLVFVGVSTTYSVEASVRSAGNLGFDVEVVSDATFTFARPDYAGTPRSAEELHVLALANMDGEYAAIIDTAAALRRMATAS
jgi:nicotinamidase-related amidase